MGALAPCLQEEGNQPQCCLCPVEGGALKPTTIPGLWCHAACMQWIPEVAVEDVSKMEPVTHIKSIQRERWELLCTICRWGHGWGRPQARVPVLGASPQRCRAPTAGLACLDRQGQGQPFSVGHWLSCSAACLLPPASVVRLQCCSQAGSHLGPLLVPAALS